MGQRQLPPRAGPQDIPLHLQRNTTCFETSGLHIPEHLGSKPIADTHVIIEPLPSFFDHYGGVWVKRGRYCLPCKPDREQKIPHPPMMHTNRLSNRVSTASAYVPPESCRSAYLTSRSLFVPG